MAGLANLAGASMRISRCAPNDGQMNQLSYIPLPFGAACVALARQIGAGKSHATEQELAHRLSPLISPVLFEEFRSRGGRGLENLSALLTAYEGDLPREEYDAFIEAVIDSNFLFLETRAPALPDILLKCSADCSRAVETIEKRLRQDRLAIAPLGPTLSRPEVRGLLRDSADLHLNGASSAILCLPDDTRVVYKERSVTNDILFQTVLGRFERFIEPIEKLLTVERENYGWQNCLERGRSVKSELAPEYFAKCGQLMFVVWLCSGNDCHASNVIASDGVPFMVDCETFFAARLGGLGPPVLTNTEGFLEELKTAGFFPIWKDGQLQNIPVLCDGTVCPMVAPATRWKNLETDVIAPFETRLARNEGTSACRVEGKIQNPSVYTRQIASGFLSARREFLSEPALSVAVEEVFSSSRRSRIIARDTLVYDTLIDQSFKPEYLRDPEARKSMVEVVLARTLPGDQFLPLIGYEIDHILQGYVPRFWINNTTGEVTGDDNVVYFKPRSLVPPYEVARHRLQVIRATDESAFEELIASSISAPE
jgi:lantibiotic modifying enzyme